MQYISKITIESSYKAINPVRKEDMEWDRLSHTMVVLLV